MPLEKAVIINQVTGERVGVMFNPEEYTVAKDNNFAPMSVPGLSGPIIQFVHGNLTTLDLELFLDTYEEHREGSRVLNKAGEDVRDLIRKITTLMEIDPEIHAPPVLLFVWGPFLFRGVLAKVSQRFLMFLPNGTPIRARLTVTFHRYIDPGQEAKEVNRQTADFSKVHVVGQGESLSGIAGKYYETPQMWRPIAMANQIVDPRSIAVGQELLIPSLPFTDPENGEVVR